MASYVIATVLIITIIGCCQGQLVCQSGYVVSDSVCAEGLNTSGCVWSSPSQLSTINPPSLIPRKIRSVSDVLLAVQQQFTQTRVLNSISLSSKSACNYPGPNWIKTVDVTGVPTCEDVYSAVIPWSEFYNTSAVDQMLWGCGLAMDDSNANYILYTGNMQVTFDDQIQIVDQSRPFNITRTTSSTLRYQMQYPKSVTIQVSLVSVSEPRVLSAVTQQVYNATDGKLRVTLFTSVQYPYRLDDITPLTSPSLTSSVQSLSSDCVDDGSSSCNQQWIIEVSRVDPKCDFSGNYSLQFQTLCQDSDAGCAVNATSLNKTVSFSLTTEDVCGSLTDVTSVSAQLSTYGQFDETGKVFSVAKTAFFPSDTAFLRLQLTSDGATLYGSTIRSVTATDVNGDVQTLFSNGVAQISSFATQLASSTSLQRIHELQFTFDPSWFGTIPADGSADSQISVTADLSFTNGKRTTVQFVSRATSPDQAQASTQVTLKAAETQSVKPVSSSASLPSITPTVLGAIIGVIVGFVIVVAFISIVIYRKIAMRR